MTGTSQQANLLASKEPQGTQEVVKADIKDTLLRTTLVFFLEQGFTSWIYDYRCAKSKATVDYLYAPVGSYQLCDQW